MSVTGAQRRDTYHNREAQRRLAGESEATAESQKNSTVRKELSSNVKVMATSYYSQSMFESRIDYIIIKSPWSQVKSKLSDNT